ncbi:MAG: DUF2834 domain-containing protein, partial [Bacteroidota bacterium]
KTLSSLAWIYLAAAIAGLIVPWYHILEHMRISGNSLSLSDFIAASTASSLAASLTYDFIIGGTAVMVWMISEALRLKMRLPWIYLLLTFTVAFAFAIPLFLFMRERELARQSSVNS